MGIGKERPQLLVLDGASCHLNFEVVQLAIKERIEIICLPAKTTSFLQPVDQILQFVILEFSRYAYKMSMVKAGFLTRPNNFPGLLEHSMRLAWPKDVIKDAFKRTGDLNN